MIHNKYFEILKLYTKDLNKSLHGRALINKVSLSQKAIALTLKELEEKGILKSSTLGNIKNYSLNIKNYFTKEILMITEIMKKIEFLNKHRKLKEIFNISEGIVGVFGSYVKGTQTKKSDIDVFIIGKKQDYNKKGKIYDLDISIKYFTRSEFKKLLNNKNNLIKEIIKDHVLISGFEDFLNYTWRYYYGFN